MSARELLPAGKYGGSADELVRDIKSGIIWIFLLVFNLLTSSRVLRAHRIDSFLIVHIYLFLNPTWNNHIEKAFNLLTSIRSPLT